jgi:8-oxo-dGTP diphosphatase
VPRVGCGCFVLSPDYPGKALFGRRAGSHGAGKYALPGGKLELDELIEECIVREIKEEVNVDLDIENVELIWTTNDRRLDGDVSKHYITVHCRAIMNDTSTITNMEPLKCEGWEWKSFEDIMALWEQGKETGQHQLFEPTQHLLATGKVDENFWAHLF